MATAAESRLDGCITFVDFMPSVIEQGSKYSSPTYEDFRTIIAKANEWLCLHPEFKVKTCESIDVPLLSEINKRFYLDTKDTVFYEPNNGYSHHVIFLRLWLVANNTSEKTGQQIGYVEQMPVCINQVGSFSSPEFETLDQTLNKLNERLKRDPLPGHVINMETQRVAFLKYKNGVDPEKTCWPKFPNKNMNFLTFLRVYFAIGQPAHEELGCADFVPNCLEKPSFGSLGEYESVDTVIQRAREWISQNASIQVTNTQTVKYIATKFQKYQVDSQCCFSYELGKLMTPLVKILRVYFTKPMPGYENMVTQSPVTLSSRVFTPPQVTFGGSTRIAKFENMEQLLERIKAWCRITVPNIFCVETSFLEEHSREKVLELQPDRSNCYVLGSKITGHVVIVRLYLSGVYDEPLLNALPPLPHITKDDSDGCSVS